MPNGPEPISILRLGVEHADSFELLRQAYAEEMGGNKDAHLEFTRNLISCGRYVVLGAFSGERIVGFCVIFELPEAIFGAVCGHLDDLYVVPEYRRRQIGRELIFAGVEIGRVRAWTHLRWIVPNSSPAATSLYKQIAELAPWQNFVIRMDPAFDL